MKSLRPLIITLFSGLVLMGSGMAAGGWASAATPTVSGSQSGSVGLQGTISSAPPSRGATITVPGNGTLTATSPITVSGICPTGLLVKVFSNNVFVGAEVCSGGSFSLQVDLFNGVNQLVARVYDSLDQAGPDSNTVNVTYNYPQFAQYGNPISLTSPYAERGAAPGTELDWPILLSGGSGPYAISIDWGDGSSPQLLSQNSGGTINLQHTYNSAGIYNVVIKVTDKNGQTAYLQLVGQATGAIQKNNGAAASSPKFVIETKVLWWPAAICIPFIIISFWLGRRYQIAAIRNRHPNE